MSLIYLCYRSSDDAVVNQIYARCVQALGRRRVLIDPEDSLPLDVSLEDHINKLIFGCQHILIIVGPNWTGLDEYGRYRLSTSDVPVYSEIRAALRSNNPITIVCVDGVSGLPPREMLPTEFHGLYDFQQITLRNETFEQDLDRIVPAPTTRQKWRHLLSMDWLALQRRRQRLLEED